MRLTLILKTLQEIFTAEAEAVWVRYPAPGDDGGWHVGLAFGALNHAQQRQMQGLERWFRGTPGSSSRSKP
jgi:hypothetical protein